MCLPLLALEAVAPAFWTSPELLFALQSSQECAYPCYVFFFFSTSIHMSSLKSFFMITYCRSIYLYVCLSLYWYTVCIYFWGWMYLNFPVCVCLVFVCVCSLCVLMLGSSVCGMCMWYKGSFLMTQWCLWQAGEGKALFGDTTQCCECPT